MIRRSGEHLDSSEFETGAGSEIRDPLETLAEEYSERRRRGDTPSISEYCLRNPELADEIRDLFPTLDLLERAASASEPRAPFEVEPPRELGEYRLLGEIGRGGMGVVYEAEQKNLGRRVALKILPPRAVADVRFAERFRLEAQAAAGLDHPGIVPVYGVGESKGLHYYAMQFIDGIGLDAVIDELRRRRLDAPAPRSGEQKRAAEIVERWLSAGASSESSTDSELGSGDSLASVSKGAPGQPLTRAIARVGLRIAEAIAGAHSRGVLHRDIKPSNILLDAKGRTWITDFGLCKLEGSGDLTQSGALVGTLRYMAPERFEGESGVQADVYGLGLILWELLSHEPAFGEGDRADIVGRITREGVPRLRDRDPATPTDLELVVRRATALDTGARYPTADAFAQDLRAFLEGRPVTARNPSLTYLARMYIRRNRSLAATIAISLILAIAGGSFAIHRLEKSRQLAEGNAETARHRESIAHLTAAAAAVGEGDSTAARARLERIAPEYQGWEWWHLRGRVDESIRNLPPGSIAAYDVQYSEDGERIYAAIANQIRTFSAQEGTILSELTTHPKQITSFDIDEETQEIVVGHKDGIVAIWDLESGELVRTLRPMNGVNCEEVRIGPGIIAAGGRDQRISIWSRSGDGPPRVLEHSAAVWAFEFTSTGEHLVSVAGDGTLRLWDHATGDLVWIAENDGGRTDALAFSPDETKIAIGSFGTALAIYDLRTGDELLSIPGGHTTGLAYIDDRRILTSSANARDGDWMQIWDVESGRPVERLRGHSRSLASVAIHPDRLRAVTASWDGSIKEWSLAFDGDPDVLTGPLDDVDIPDWSPDGDWVAAPSRDSTVRVWDARTGRLRRTLIGVRWGVSKVRFIDRWTLVGVGAKDLVVWDLRDGSVRAWAPFSAQVRPRMEVLPDRSGLLMADQSGTLHRFSLPDLVAEAPVHLQDVGVTAIAIDGAGRRFATGLADHRIRVWDLETLTLEHEWDAHQDLITTLAFHPDGRRLVSGSHDQSLRLWDVEAGSEITTLTTGNSELWLHTEALSSAEFSPSGDRLAVGSHDSSIRLWDIESRLEVAMLRGHTGWTMGVSWNPDGTILATGNSDRTVRMWRTLPRSEGFEERESLWRIDLRAKEFVTARLEAGDSLSTLAQAILDDTSLSAEEREARLGHVHATLGTREALLDVAWEILTRRFLLREPRELGASLVFGQRVRYGKDQRQSVLWGIAELRAGRLESAAFELENAVLQRPTTGRDVAVALGLLAELRTRKDDEAGGLRAAAQYTEALLTIDPATRKSLESVVLRLRDCLP